MAAPVDNCVPMKHSTLVIHRVAGPPYCCPQARCGPCLQNVTMWGRVCFDRVTRRYFWTGGQHWEFSLCDRWSERGSVLGRDVGQGHRYMFDKREIVCKRLISSFYYFILLFLLLSLFSLLYTTN